MLSIVQQIPLLHFQEDDGKKRKAETEGGKTKKRKP